MTHNIPMGGTSGVEVVAEGGVSRRSVLQLAAFLGAGSLLGPSLVACAGPQTTGGGSLTGGDRRQAEHHAQPQPGSLDNKLNQYDAAVTVQRAVRQALTRIGLDLKPELVLAKSFDADLPHRVDRRAARRHPLLRQVTGHGRRRRDRDQALLPGQGRLRRLAVPRAAHLRQGRRQELHPHHQEAGRHPRLADVQHPHHAGRGQQGRGAARRHRLRTVHGRRRRLRHRHLPPRAQRELLGREGPARRGQRQPTRRRRARGSSRSPPARPTSSTRSPRSRPPASSPTRTSRCCRPRAPA